MPHIENSYNYLEIYNEISVLLFYYNMLGFQTSSIGPLVAPEFQWILGFLTMGFVGLIYLVNFLLMLKEIYRKIRQSYYKVVKYIHKKQKKNKGQMKKRELTVKLITNIISSGFNMAMDESARPLHVKRPNIKRRKKILKTEHLRKPSLSVIYEVSERDQESQMPSQGLIQLRNVSRQTTRKGAMNMYHIRTESLGNVSTGSGLVSP